MAAAASIAKSTDHFVTTAASGPFERRGRRMSLGGGGGRKGRANATTGDSNSKNAQDKKRRKDKSPSTKSPESSSHQPSRNSRRFGFFRRRSDRSLSSTGTKEDESGPCPPPGTEDTGTQTPSASECEIQETNVVDTAANEQLVSPMEAALRSTGDSNRSLDITELEDERQPPPSEYDNQGDEDGASAAFKPSPRMSPFSRKSYHAALRNSRIRPNLQKYIEQQQHFHSTTSLVQNSQQSSIGDVDQGDADPRFTHRRSKLIQVVEGDEEEESTGPLAVKRSPFGVAVSSRSLDQVLLEEEKILPIAPEEEEQEQQQEQRHSSRNTSAPTKVSRNNITSRERERESLHESNPELRTNGLSMMQPQSDFHSSLPEFGHHPSTTGYFPPESTRSNPRAAGRANMRSQKFHLDSSSKNSPTTRTDAANQRHHNMRSDDRISHRHLQQMETTRANVRNLNHSSSMPVESTRSQTSRHEGRYEARLENHLESTRTPSTRHMDNHVESSRDRQRESSPQEITSSRRTPAIVSRNSSDCTNTRSQQQRPGAYRSISCRHVSNAPEPVKDPRSRSAVRTRDSSRAPSGVSTTSKRISQSESLNYATPQSLYTSTSRAHNHSRTDARTSPPNGRQRSTRDIYNLNISNHSSASTRTTREHQNRPKTLVTTRNQWMSTSALSTNKSTNLDSSHQGGQQSSSRRRTPMDGRRSNGLVHPDEQTGPGSYQRDFSSRSLPTDVRDHGVRGKRRQMQSGDMYDLHRSGHSATSSATQSIHSNNPSLQTTKLSSSSSHHHYAGDDTVPNGQGLMSGMVIVEGSLNQEEDDEEFHCDLRELDYQDEIWGMSSDDDEDSYDERVVVRRNSNDGSSDQAPTTRRKSGSSRASTRDSARAMAYASPPPRRPLPSKNTSKPLDKIQRDSGPRSYADALLKRDSDPVRGIGKQRQNQDSEDDYGLSAASNHLSPEELAQIEMALMEAEGTSSTTDQHHPARPDSFDQGLSTHEMNMIKRAIDDADSGTFTNVDRHSGVSPAEAAAIERAIAEADAFEEAKSLQLAMRMQEEEERCQRERESFFQSGRQPQGNVRTMTRAELQAEQNVVVGAFGTASPPLRHPLERTGVVGAFVAELPPPRHPLEAETEEAAGFRMNSNSGPRHEWSRRDQSSIVGPNSQVRTKHDTNLDAEANAYDLGIVAEEDGSYARVGNRAYNNFKKSMKQRSSRKGVAAHGTGRAGSDSDGTKGGAMDNALLEHAARLLNAGWISQLNGVVKEGKEAVIFHGEEGEKSGGYDVALKVFKRIQEFRGRANYVDGDPRYSSTSFRNMSSREQLETWCEKEFRNLVRANRSGVPVPTPLAFKDNVLLMRFLGNIGFPSPQLRECDLRKGSSRWRALYQQVMHALGVLYRGARLVHGDLSEYNIMVVPANLVQNRDPSVRISRNPEQELQAVFIDFGQAVDIHHPDATTLLERDIDRVHSFFSKQGIEVLPRDEVMTFVQGFEAY